MLTAPKPRLDGSWRLIAPSPDLTSTLGPGNAPSDKPDAREFNAVVDHHLYADIAGDWHLWACVRNTSVGRILHHWRTNDFFASPWEDTGRIMRCDLKYGESIDDYDAMEWLQSPYVVRDARRFHMFYGGHTTGADLNGKPAVGDDPRNECQMCLMTSSDGIDWVRHRNGDGTSRIFVGPGEVRDPCVRKIRDMWYCYYAGYRDQDKKLPCFFCRTSEDLMVWSEPIRVHEDHNIADGMWATECPHVIERNGLFYLLRTEHYYQAKTHVFCSDDPLDFGIGDASEKYLGQLAVAAPEIIVGPDDREYVSSAHNPPLGIQVAPLVWE